MLRKSLLLVALVGSAATAAPIKSAAQSMTVEEALSSGDSVADRDRQRETEARWFLVGTDTDSMYMVDRKTLQRRGAIRSGWVMAIKFAAGKIPMRAAIHQNWDCNKRTATTLVMQTYDENGTPDPMRTSPERAEPIVPDTLGESALNYVCDRSAHHGPFPMALSRDPVSAARILAAYADGSEVTVLGLLLATLDPWKDEARLQSLLEFEKPDKRAKLTQLIWGGLR